VIRAVPLLVLPVLALAACKRAPAEPISAAWSDDFERAALGADWHATDAEAYRITGGELNVQGAYNHPLWLRRAIPRDAVIEFDAKSMTTTGDIKVEAWGNGKHHAASKAKVQYTASGYVFIMGGWGNSKSIIAKRSEHGKDVVERSDFKVEPGKTYRWKIVRKGNRIDWYVDDMTTPFLSLDDAAPLEGDAQRYFAFSNWESDLWFDNLTIAPTP
jgi:hypothetical protein